jgi:sugar phosphate isomerase/epimerase
VTNRREFLIATSGLLAASSFAKSWADDQASASAHKLCVFTKPFNSLSFDELADKIAALGFNGIEAPIRAGGHIEPAQVEDRLPELVQALAKRNLEITVMTTDINDPDDPLTERVLRTAATLGIKRYRMQYFKYNLDLPVISQIHEWQPQLKDLAAINHDFEVRGLYQNHAGRNYLGAALWDVRMALEGIPVEDIAVAYDIRHAIAEAGMSWPVTFNMIQPLVDTVYVKDFAWEGDKLLDVPLGQGRVGEEFFQLLKASGFDGPISLHEEYLDHRQPELVPDHLTAIEKDLATLKGWL